jgi:hypothetical protein
VLLHCPVKRLSRLSDEKSGSDARSPKAIDEDRISWAIG